MLGAIVGSNLDFQKSRFLNKVNLNSANIGRNFYLANAKFRTKLAKLALVGITVSGTLSFAGTQFCDPQREITESGTLSLAGTQFCDPQKSSNDPDDPDYPEVRLNSAKIGTIEYKGIKNLNELDLRGAHVDKLLVSSFLKEKNWVDYIPEHLNLRGFTYNQVVVENENDSENQNNEKPDGNQKHQSTEKWYDELEIKMTDYSPQPYEQAAKVLRESGQPELANKMLTLRKDKERDNALKDGKFRYIWLTLQKNIIGYGIGFGYLKTLFWIIPLWLIGTFICFTTRDYAEMCKLLVDKTRLGEGQKCGSDNSKGENLSSLGENSCQFKGNDEKHNSNACKEADNKKMQNAMEKHGLLDSAAYSFDMMLPLIRLWGMHERIDTPGWQRYYFYFHKMAGWFLFTFIAAGLTGLIKK